MKVTLNFQTPHLVRALFAREKENLLLLGKTLGVQAVARDNFIRLAGPKPAVERARKLLQELADIVETGKPLTGSEYRRILKATSGNEKIPIRDIYGDGRHHPDRSASGAALRVKFSAGDSKGYP